MSNNTLKLLVLSFFGRNSLFNENLNDLRRFSRDTKKSAETRLNSYAIPILSLSISPDADYIAALYADNSIRVFSVTYGKCISVFNPPPSPMTREFPLKVSTIDPPVKSYPVQNLVFPSLPFIESQICVPTIKEVVLKGLDDFAYILGNDILSTEPPRSQPINISPFSDSLFSEVIEPRDLVSISVQTEGIIQSPFPEISSEVCGTDYLKEIITPPEIVDLTYQVPPPDTTANIAVSPLSEVLFIPDILPSLFDSPGDLTIISPIAILPGIQEIPISLDLLTESCPTTRLFPVCDIFPLPVYPLLELEIFPEPEPCIIEPETPPPPPKPYLKFDPQNPYGFFFIVFPEFQIQHYSEKNQYNIIIQDSAESKEICSEEPILIQKETGIFTEHIEIPILSPSLGYIITFNKEFEPLRIIGIKIDSYLIFSDRGEQLPKPPKTGEFWFIIRRNRAIVPDDSILCYEYLEGNWSDYYAIKVDASKNPQISDEPNKPFIEITWIEKDLIAPYVYLEKSHEPVYRKLPKAKIKSDSLSTIKEISVFINGNEASFDFSNNDQQLDFNSDVNLDIPEFTDIEIRNSRLIQFKKHKKIFLINGFKIKFDKDIYLPSINEQDFKIELSLAANTVLFNSLTNGVSRNFSTSNSAIFSGIIPRDGQFKVELFDRTHSLQIQLLIIIPQLQWKFLINKEGDWNQGIIRINQDEFEKLDIHRQLKVKIPESLQIEGEVFLSSNPEEVIKKRFKRGVAVFPVGVREYLLEEINEYEFETKIKLYNDNSSQNETSLFIVDLWRIIEFHEEIKLDKDSWRLTLNWKENYKSENKIKIILSLDDNEIYSETWINSINSCNIPLTLNQFPELRYYSIQFIRGEINNKLNIFPFFHGDKKLIPIIELINNDTPNDLFSAFVKLLELVRDDEELIRYWKLIIQDHFIAKKKIDLCLELLYDCLDCNFFSSDKDLSILNKLLLEPIIRGLHQDESLITSLVAIRLMEVIKKIHDTNSNSFQNFFENDLNSTIVIVFISSEKFLEHYCENEDTQSFDEDNTLIEQQLCIQSIRLNIIDINKRPQNTLNAIREIVKKTNVSSEEIEYYLILIYLCIHTKRLSQEELMIAKEILQELRNKDEEDGFASIIIKKLQDFDSSKIIKSKSSEAISKCVETLNKLKEIL